MLLVLSCKKKDEQIGQNGQIGQIQQVKSCRNPNNPYDSLASIHNVELSYLITHATLPIGRMSYVFAEFDTLFKCKTPSWFYHDSTFQKLITESQNANSIHDFLTNGSYMSSLGIAYSDTIDAKMALFVPIDSANFFNEIINLETRISSNTSLNSQDKKILLMEAAISRYSASYWSNSRNQQLWDLRYPWGQLLGSDAHDAMVGGLAGAAVGGTVTLGTCTVPAWVGGAVIGGAGGSAAYAFGYATGWW